jgi:hypothetical protein
VGPLVRLGRGEGLGVAVGFSWFSAGLGAEGGARVSVRPIMAGLGYTVRRDQFSVATSLVGGYAFNSLGLLVPSAADMVPVEVGNSFAWRPSISVWRDIGERTALNVSLSYVRTGLDVTYLRAGQLETRDVSGNTAISENTIRKNSSSPPSRSLTNRVMAERAADIFSADMLPLESTRMPRLTGTRSLLKCVISCSTPSS